MTAEEVQRLIKTLAKKQSTREKRNKKYGHWKQSTIIIIKKPNKLSNRLSSYRPISLLPAISKIIQKIIHNRQTDIIEERNLLPPHKPAFNSTPTSNSIRVTENII